MNDRSENSSAQAQRFFFVHLQKTAGTSLFRRLQRHFGERAIYPNDSDGDRRESVLLVDHLLDRWRERGAEIRVVTGHFPLCTASLLGVPFTTFTVLRHPVDRTLSYLRHHRKVEVNDRDRALVTIYDDPLRFPGLIHNHMVKMLSLSADDMTAGAMTRVTFTRAHLETAEQRLTELDAFGLHDDFEGFCDEIGRRFGWNLGDPVRFNRTEPVDVSDSLVDRIAEDNVLDLELYEFAARLHASRRATGVSGAGSTVQ